MTYFLVDLLWVAWTPICVKSPDVIIKVRNEHGLSVSRCQRLTPHFLSLQQHHLVAMAYMIAPVYLPEFRFFMGACLSVEINTWFLILRRVIFKYPNLPFVLTESVSVAFYVSWIAIRCFVYPYVLYDFLRRSYDAILETHRLHWPMICIPVHFFLCVLNFKWTYDLFSPMVKKWMGGSSAVGGKQISDGL